MSSRSRTTLFGWTTMAVLVAGTLLFWRFPIGADGVGRQVERGRYLVTVGGCGDCHSPKVLGPEGPVEDATRLLSGHPEGMDLGSLPTLGDPWIAATTGDLTAWVGPWGVSFATNLTPDENTGIGSWSEETFVKALRTGRHMGAARPILPPMPWQNFAKMSDEDLGAVYAYLRGLPPIHNRVPEPLPPAGGAVATAG